MSAATSNSVMLNKHKHNPIRVVAGLGLGLGLVLGVFSVILLEMTADMHGLSFNLCSCCSKTHQYTDKETAVLVFQPLLCLLNTIYGSHNRTLYAKVVTAN